MCATLRDLLDTGRVSMAILSGRALDDLARKVPFPAVLGGNHGFEMRGPGIEFRHPEAQRLQPALAQAREALCAAIAGWPGAWVEDKGLTVTVHYRQVHPCGQRALVVAVRKAMARFGLTFGMRAGKKAVEVYPRCDWNKGEALVWIRSALRMAEAPVIAVGDDRTDEWMFTANRGGVNIHVGPACSATCAEYYVADYIELMAAFAHIAGALGSARMVGSARTFVSGSG
jgi:trehalose 6-phosphate phosphatase